MSETRRMILPRALFEQLEAHARASAPAECCGEVGGRGALARTLYPMRNVAADPLVRYEAAPEDLTAAQRLMRERGERLLGIYHSHPQEAEPAPSATDIRMAFYPEALYLLIGFDAAGACVLRAFRIVKQHPYDDAGRYVRAPFEVTDEAVED